MPEVIADLQDAPNDVFWASFLPTTETQETPPVQDMSPDAYKATLPQDTVPQAGPAETCNNDREVLLTKVFCGLIVLSLTGGLAAEYKSWLDVNSTLQHIKDRTATTQIQRDGFDTVSVTRTISGIPNTYAATINFGSCERRLIATASNDVDGIPADITSYSVILKNGKTIAVENMQQLKAPEVAGSDPCTTIMPNTEAMPFKTGGRARGFGSAAKASKFGHS